MSHDLKALSRRWFDEVWNDRRLDVVPELSHEHAVVYGLVGDGKPAKIADFIPFRERFLQTFPDFHIKVDDVIQEGDKTVVRLTATGTHEGDAMGIAPTGRRVNLSALIMTRWKDGKIIEAWNEFDAWGMMQQLTGPAAMKIK